MSIAVRSATETNHAFLKMLAEGYIGDSGKGAAFKAILTKAML